MKPIIVIAAIALLPLCLWSQITGTVEVLENGKAIPLPGGNVYWKGTETGTITDKEGKFAIDPVPGKTTLIASFIGYQPQSKIIISRKGEVNFSLQAENEVLDGAEVIAESDATAIDLKKAELTYKIDDKELRKAACCNLSESFETNASVDVSFTDAVTGTRQIEMLGLAGKYALIQRENIPFARGMNTMSGLTFIPGPFVESIQLTKGLSSVINGYESITGQINVEFYKPETAPRLFLNLYGNQGGRMEMNAITRFKVSNNVSSAILFHASAVPIVWDNNEDGFADIPNGNQFNLTNRWHFKNDNGWEGQLGFTAIQDIRTGGQTDFINEQNPADSLWGVDATTRRFELFGKNGYVFKDKPYRSIGIIYSYNYQDKDATFGNRDYFCSQNSVYLNTIYQDILGNTQHKYRTGLSLLADQVVEELSPENTNAFLYQHNRNEIVPGAYFEYTYEPSPRFTLVAGVRGDYNSYFEQAYITPRLNLRYNLSEYTTFRAGGGRGQRTYNAIMENQNVLASSRVVNAAGISTILPEIAWNSGASISQNIHLSEKEIKLTVDAFYTWFDNKLVVDLDADPNLAYFLNQQGSRSFSLFSQIDYEIIKSFDLRLAYKYLDAKDQFINGLDFSYLIPQHRAFANLAYGTESQWKFDLTVNWYGNKRLPNTENSPVAFQREGFSPDFFTVNTQINKVLKNNIELFIGADNLLDFRQGDPIVNPDNPYAPYFDTNFTWAPIFGRNIYVGLYYTLK